MSANSFLFTSESVTEGHPDKVCDAVSDAILDAHLAQDPAAHVACETLVKGAHLVLAGEISSRAEVDHETVARRVIDEIGYREGAFQAETVHVTELISRQSEEIADGVEGKNDSGAEQGAGDQGLMFGYATDETPELMPLPITLAHRLTRGLAEDRHAGRIGWLRPDGKSQVTVRYRDGRPVEVTKVVISTQHRDGFDQGEIEAYVRDDLIPRALGDWSHRDIELLVNPSGSFSQGGPEADAGVTGRKIICDTYGGFARHGGGAFSGKDPSKVDRSAAYFARYVARRIVEEGFARKAEIQVAYAIGQAKPLSILVDTFSTGDPAEARAFAERFDFRPAQIIEQLDLLRPIYRKTTNYGHFGRKELPWEATVPAVARPFTGRASTS